jgi:hypothetical protein
MPKLAPLPKLSLEIDIPLRADDVAKRHHNRFVKEAINEVLIAHHRFRLPGHFERSAHGKYGYRQRSEKYIREKARRYHSVVDLVKSGKSKNRMMHEQRIVIGGSAEGGKKPIDGKLIVSFDFQGGGGRRYRKRASPQAVLIETMHKEIQAITDDERGQIAHQFREAYLQRLRNFRSSRLRVRTPTT